MITTVVKEWRFDAAHQLENHDGKCRRPHGHTYRVSVAVEGPVADIDGASDEGMVMDFAELDAAWKAIEPRLDHQDLNVTLFEEVGVTTSEHLAMFLLGHFQRCLHDVCRAKALGVVWVRVSETPSTYAEARA